MYNKIFTKILDSSIWLEPTPTRIVWITLIAAMDETGYAHFSAIGNLSSRARITDKEAEEAINILTSPDKNSSDPEFDGRRIERVPGGFIVLNAEKYRDIVKRAVQQQRTKERVRDFRARKKEAEKEVLPTPETLPPGNSKDKPPKATKKAEPEGLKAVTKDAWQAYADAYFNRYGTEPVRNAKVNSQLVQFIQRIGKDEAPGVAAFYVSNNNAFYVARGHAIGLLLSDAEKLRTEWATNRQITSTQAGHMDKRSATQQVFRKLIDKADDE